MSGIHHVNAPLDLISGLYAVFTYTMTGAILYLRHLKIVDTPGFVPNGYRKTQLEYKFTRFLVALLPTNTSCIYECRGNGRRLLQSDLRDLASLSLSVVQSATRPKLVIQYSTLDAAAHGPQLVIQLPQECWL